MHFGGPVVRTGAAEALRNLSGGPCGEACAAPSGRWGVGVVFYKSWIEVGELTVLSPRDLSHPLYIPPSGHLSAMIRNQFTHLFQLMIQKCETSIKIEHGLG